MFPNYTYAMAKRDSQRSLAARRARIRAALCASISRFLYALLPFELGSLFLMFALIPHATLV